MTQNVTRLGLAFFSASTGASEVEATEAVTEVKRAVKASIVLGWE
jgi:hypothetical protein